MGEILLLPWILAGCFLGILTGLAPGIHINTVAAIATTLSKEASLETAMLIVGMSIVHCFVDFVPSILFCVPEENTFLSILPGHRMLLKGKAMLAIRLVSTGAFFSGIIALTFSPFFMLFVNKGKEFFPNIIPIVLIGVLIIMIFGEKGLEKKKWAVIVIFLSALLGIIALGNNSTIKEPLFACITGFFGAATAIESISKKTIFPKQETKETKIRKKIIAEGSLLGFLAGSIVAILPSIGSNQAAFIIKKIFGKIGTKKFLVILGGNNTSNMILGFLVLFAWNKTRSGSAAAINELIKITFENTALICTACLIALGFGFTITIAISKFFIKKMEKINYQKANIAILAILCILVPLLSNIAGIIAFITATGIGMIAASKGVKRTNCMAFLMLPAIIFYLGF